MKYKKIFFIVVIVLIILFSIIYIYYKNQPQQKYRSGDCVDSYGGIARIGYFDGTNFYLCKKIGDGAFVARDNDDFKGKVDTSQCAGYAIIYNKYRNLCE